MRFYPQLSVSLGPFVYLSQMRETPLNAFSNDTTSELVGWLVLHVVPLMINVSEEVVDINFYVIGLTRLGITPAFTV